MRKMYAACAGIDVHKKNVVVCLLKVDSKGQISREVRSFGTSTGALLELLDWLVLSSCESVAMESTGVYWKPVFNLLDSSMEVVLVNAQHVKALPGRKTDVKDCEWLAELHLHGLIQASFIPPREIRELRDFVRTRMTLTAERAKHVNRIQKVLEDANLKLSSVATDVLGVSGRLMLNAIVAGEIDPGILADLARGRMRSKRPELRDALTGRIRPHHRLLLQTHLNLIDGLDEAIATLTAQIEECMRPFAELRERLTTIPGVGNEVATVFISEMGVDMSPWPTFRHAASWAGLCPGHHESAGKRKSGRTRHGNRWIKQVFTQAAWSAQRANGTYLQAHFRRIRSKRGPRKAAVAVAHSILVRCYLLAKTGDDYKDLGSTYFDDRAKTAITQRLVRRLKNLGYQVELTNAA
ncbi:MAG: IS110 family transposase [Planctomycetaceae bacterium]|nr:IS110 family transposase [Phycisphaerales bacterium]MCB9875957.1 IS110 family transposase [Planctomycetaceae bacterium]MCB9852945.1 IS110 family transposase [Phycisphaerales bacterium]MCB9854770.1 IS110 family transposase [Phycisphaerales bacterium]MCB9854886.1 IS110 family transposase [Phycisphaerales bacterium]